MAKTITEEQRAKMQAANAARIEKRAEVLKIGKHEVYFYDADNWAVRTNGETDLRFYPTKATALHYVLHRQIGDAPSKSIAEVLLAAKNAEAEILRAVRG